MVEGLSAHSLKVKALFQLFFFFFNLWTVSTVLGKVNVSRGSSLSSIPLTTDSPDRNGFVKSSTSEDSLDKRNGYGHSW